MILSNSIQSQEKQSPDVFEGYKDIKFFTSIDTYKNTNFSLVNQDAKLKEYSIILMPSDTRFLETTISAIKVFEYKSHIVSITLYLNDNVDELLSRLFKSTKKPKSESFIFKTVEYYTAYNRDYETYDYWKELRIFEGENIRLIYGNYSRNRWERWGHNLKEKLVSSYYLTIEVLNYENKIDNKQVLTNYENYFSNMGINPTTKEPNINEKLDKSTNIVSKSDLSTNVPKSGYINNKSYALIIGNQNYNNDIKVPFAINDALVVKEYFNKTLGIPEKNIHLILDGTYGNIINEIDWIRNIQKIYQNEVKVYIYYAGHGVPNDKTKLAYILPVDGNSLNTRTAIALEDLFNDLKEYNSKLITIFLDACFTGDSRAGMLQSARAVRVRPKVSSFSGNIIVFSATTNDETALTFNEQSHGLFTFYLLKAFQETKGNLNYKQLFDFLNNNIPQKSLLLNNKIQTPSMIISPQLENNWENIFLIK